MPVSMETAAAFFAAALVLAVAPGPDNIFVLTQSALYGRAAGAVTTLGLATGLCFHTTVVALGVAALLKNFPAAFMGLKILGAIYLIYLAWLTFKSTAQAADTDSRKSFPGYGALYRRGVIMNVTNPKVTLFFLAFLPQFIQYEAGNAALQTAFFGLLFAISTLIVFNTVAILGGALAAVFNKSSKGQIIINRIAAGVYLALAVALIVKS